MSTRNELKESVVETLASMDAPRFAELADDVEGSDDELEDALTELQMNGRVRFSGRQLGYLLVDEARNE